MYVFCVRKKYIETPEKHTERELRIGEGEVEQDREIVQKKNQFAFVYDDENLRWKIMSTCFEYTSTSTYKRFVKQIMIIFPFKSETFEIFSHSRGLQSHAYTYLIEVERLTFCRTALEAVEAD